MKTDNITLKEILEALRARTKKQFKDNVSISKIYEGISPKIEGGEDYEVVTSISLPGLLATAFKQAEAELKNAGIVKPCNYAIMGFGSMATQQATPYSDLEFAIIIEHKDNTAGSITKYFKELTTVVLKKMIAVGETYEKGKNAKKGVCFDTWDKTPLGKKGKYELIQTKEEFIQDLKNKNNTTVKKKDILLDTMLANTCFVYGKEALYKAYELDAAKWLKDARTNKSMSHKLLVEDRTIGLGADDWKNPKKVMAAKPILISSKQLIDNLNKKIAQKKFLEIDIKQELYRPLTILKSSYAETDKFNSLKEMEEFIRKLRLEHNEFYQGREKTYLGAQFLNKHTEIKEKLEWYRCEIKKLFEIILKNTVYAGYSNNLHNYGVNEWNTGYAATDNYKKVVHFQNAQTAYEQAAEIGDKSLAHSYFYGKDGINKWLIPAAIALHNDGVSKWNKGHTATDNYKKVVHFQNAKANYEKAAEVLGDKHFAHSYVYGKDGINKWLIPAAIALHNDGVSEWSKGYAATKISEKIGYFKKAKANYEKAAEVLGDKHLTHSYVYGKDVSVKKSHH